MKWAIKTGTSTIPKSVKPRRIAENLASPLNVKLDDDDMRALQELDKQARYVDGSFWCMPGSSSINWAIQQIERRLQSLQEFHVCHQCGIVLPLCILLCTSTCPTTHLRRRRPRLYINGWKIALSVSCSLTGGKLFLRIGERLSDQRV